MRRATLVWLCWCGLPAPAAFAQVEGYVSLMADSFPRVAIGDSATQPVFELRARVFAERRFDIGERVRVTAAGFADGLLADRGGPRPATAAVLRPQELHLQAEWARFDLRVGISRVVWGRLDELQPTDVVNPLDLARFFLEGRAEGRRPVGMVRGRWLPHDRFTLEAIYVPLFRRGTFDQLDEPTSPFNLAPVPPALVTRVEPARRWGSAQGGARMTVTTGRVDWAVAAYRGFEPLPVYELRPAAPPSAIAARHPRFTMIGGDFETVRGPWGLRGEVAVFARRTYQAARLPVAAEGRGVEAGIGVDRRAGAYRLGGNVIATTRSSPAARDAIDRSDVTLVGVLDRSFARETRAVRVFGVYNPREGSAFARAIASFAWRDNLSLEVSGGWFTGNGRDALSRLATRDFVYARLKVLY